MLVTKNYERHIPDPEVLEPYHVEYFFGRTRFGGDKTKEAMDDIFKKAMNYFVSGTQEGNYRRMRSGEMEKQEFLKNVESFIKNPAYGVSVQRNPADAVNDIGVLMKRLEDALCGYYILSPLIADENITDINICSWDDIRVRVHGKSRPADISFIDEMDLWHFIYGITVQNHQSFDSPEVTFSDDNNPGYKLRFVISTPVINCVPYPYVSIRKNFRAKLTPEQLIQGGLINRGIWNYLQDCAITEPAVIFAGPPGSGKTRLLNAFIEAIPPERDIVVIQENDELVSNKSGIKFKKVTKSVPIDRLCELALVECCNEFIIGEAKGAEMRYFATLLNSGGYGALTLHATNVYEILPKAADLIKYGSDYSYQDALKRLSPVSVVVFMSGYKVQQIAETSWNEEKKDFDYKMVYDYNNEETGI